jgi:hypothetical protein
MTKVEPTSSSILDAKWWPFGVAAGWVLSRNERFAAECHQETNPPIAAVRNAAYQWRRDIKVDGCSLGRRPIMLFPSEEIAAEQLQAEVEAGRIRCKDNAFSAANIRSRFPQIDNPDRARVADSMWQGHDPNKRRRVSLSHAAWWIASKQGTTPFALDDSAAWASAFTPLLQSIVDKDVQVFGVAQPPVQKVPADSFDGVPVEYPARASEGSGGSPYSLGYHTFIAADLLEHGDRYYARGKREAIWRGLQLSTADLLKCFRKGAPGSLAGAPNKYDWDEGFLFMLKELKQRGDPLKPENVMPGWKSDADVGKAVAAHIRLKDGTEPDHNHCMRRIKPKLREWRSGA